MNLDMDFGFHKISGICWQSEELLASQEGLHPMVGLIACLLVGWLDWVLFVCLLVHSLVGWLVGLLGWVLFVCWLVCWMVG